MTNTESGDIGVNDCIDVVAMLALVTEVVEAIGRIHPGRCKLQGVASIVTVLPVLVAMTAVNGRIELRITWVR